jgi:hypothetical protein
MRHQCFPGPKLYAIAEALRNLCDFVVIDFSGIARVNKDDLCASPNAVKITNFRQVLKFLWDFTFLCWDEPMVSQTYLGFVQLAY